MTNWTHEKTGNYEAEQAERETIFRKVAPKGNWKSRINAWIDATDFDECNNAAIWFAASPLMIVERRTKGGTEQVRVHGEGYYVMVGA